jgi:hypothetical protein
MSDYTEANMHYILILSTKKAQHFLIIRAYIEINDLVF